MGAGSACAGSRLRTGRPFRAGLTNLAQPEVARIPLGFPPAQEALAVSPVTPWACPQDALEPVLLEHARSSAQAQLVFGTELSTLEQDDTGVSVRLLERTNGSSTLVRARYVVAADGAH